MCCPRPELAPVPPYFRTRDYLEGRQGYLVTPASCQDNQALPSPQGEEALGKHDAVSFPGWVFLIWSHESLDQHLAHCWRAETQPSCKRSGRMTALCFSRAAGSQSCELSKLEPKFWLTPCPVSKVTLTERASQPSDTSHLQWHMLRQPKWGE